MHAERGYASSSKPLVRCKQLFGALAWCSEVRRKPLFPRLFTRQRRLGERF